MYKVTNTSTAKTAIIEKNPSYYYSGTSWTFASTDDYIYSTNPKVYLIDNSAPEGFLHKWFVFADTPSENTNISPGKKVVIGMMLYNTDTDKPGINKIYQFRGSLLHKTGLKAVPFVSHMSNANGNVVGTGVNKNSIYRPQTLEMDHTDDEGISWNNQVIRAAINEDETSSSKNPLCFGFYLYNNTDTAISLACDGNMTVYEQTHNIPVFDPNQ